MDKAFRLDGRVALVTGSSQGIGLAIAHGLGTSGARVVVNGRNADKVQTAVETLKRDGVNAVASVFDVIDRQAVADGIAGIERDVGAIAILVNNAGMQKRGALESYADSDWDLLMRTNLDSVYNVSKAVAQGMIARKRGAIINICSVMSELGRPSIAPYTASKGAVKMFTKGMAAEWGKHGIRVNGIGPGYFKTELNNALVADRTFSSWVEGRTPLGRWGETAELAGAAVFLASDAASFVTGHILYVDGGMTSVV
jgi:gluconate 5-dehydrogenase